MLLNVKRPGRSQLDIVLDTMDASPFEFHLTGSRFFDCATEKSDWDFFVGINAQLGTSLGGWLDGMGFVRVANSYSSADVNSVFQHRTEKIHIQVVKDAGHKIRAQKMLYALKDFLRVREMAKPKARDLWNTALNLTRQ